MNEKQSKAFLDLDEASKIKYLNTESALKRTPLRTPIRRCHNHIETFVNAYDITNTGFKVRYPAYPDVTLLVDMTQHSVYVSACTSQALIFKTSESVCDMRNTDTRLRTFAIRVQFAEYVMSRIQGVSKSVNAYLTALEFFCWSIGVYFGATGTLGAGAYCALRPVVNNVHGLPFIITISLDSLLVPTYAQFMTAAEDVLQRLVKCADDFSATFRFSLLPGVQPPATGRTL